MPSNAKLSWAKRSWVGGDQETGPIDPAALRLAAPVAAVDEVLSLIDAARRRA